MILKLNDIVLPHYVDFEENTDAMAAKNRALSGKLNVDHWADINEWRVKFPILDTSDFDTMNAIYKSQVTSGEMVHFEVISDDVNIDVRGWMSPPSRKIKWRGTAVDGFEFTIEARDASG